MSDWIAHHPRKIPLRVVLVVPLVLQVVTAVGFATYLSVRNGQQAINNTASQLMVGVGDQVDAYLDHYTASAQQINQAAAHSIKMGFLKLTPESVGMFFASQTDSLGLRRIGFSGLDGRTVEAEFEQQQLFVVERTAAPTEQAFILDPQGNLKSVPHTSSPRQPLDFKHWQQQALDVGKPTWSPIYSWADLPDHPQISAITPVYDRAHQSVGVVSVDLELAPISAFLRKLDVGKSGEVFLINHRGELVASSTDEPASMRVNGTLKRRSAEYSRDPLIQATARQLMGQFSDLRQVQSNELFSFNADGQRSFVRVRPYTDQFGLSWLIVVVVPEADFVAEIQRNNFTIALFCAGALTAAIALGWFTASWIAQPILRLSRSSRTLALGEWEEPVDEKTRVSELEVLAHSFNQMARHLQKSFDQVKTELQESEEKFTKVFRNCPDAISISILPERRYIEVNDTFLALTGYTREEVLGHTAQELNLTVNTEQVAQFESLLQNEQWVRDVEIDYRTKAGQRRTVLVASESIELEGQLCLISIYKDITDRKHLEIALQRSEAKLNDILNSAIASITSIRIYSNQEWQYDYWSRGCETIFGYTAQELIAHPTLWISRIPAEDLEHVPVKQIQMVEHTQAFASEYRFCHKDGSLRWISGYITARFDATSNCWIATAVDIDITGSKRIEAERQQSQVALQQSEANLREAQRVAHIGSWEYDAIAQTTIWSEEMRRIHGLDPQSASPTPEAALQAIHPDDRAAFSQFLEQAMLAGRSYEQDVRIVRPDGSSRRVEIRAVPIFNEQNVLIRLVGTTLDITERRQTEAALRESEQRFRSAFDTSILSMSITALDGRLLQVNKAICQLTGYSQSELLTMQFQDLSHPDDLPQDLELAQKLLAGEITSYQIEKRYRHKRGHVFWGLLNVSLVRDAQQQPLYFIAQTQAIGEKSATIRQEV